MEIYIHVHIWKIYVESDIRSRMTEMDNFKHYGDHFITLSFMNKRNL